MRLMRNIKQKTFTTKDKKILTGSSILSTINKIGVALKAIFSDFATAIALGITSANTIIKIDITIDETIVPKSSPKSSINMPVDIVVHKVLAIQLPIRRVLITFSLILRIDNNSSALLLPSDFSFWMRPGDVAVIAVSVAEIKPDTASKQTTKDMTIRSINLFFKKIVYRILIS